MGLSFSKAAATNEIPMKDATDNSIDVDLPATPTFSALRRLRSLGSKYEKFSENSSMNNLESPTGLKQRLIKALGGYNPLDPRSPSQVIARTPINLNKKMAKKSAPIATESIFDTSLDISGPTDEDPYRIFEEEQVVDQTPMADQTPSLDSLAIDPRSPTEGIPRTPFIAGNEISAEVIKTETKPQTLMKSMYKDLIRRDPIYRDLLHEDDDEISKTTPVKKIQERTPLSSLANKNIFNSTPIKPNQVKQFSDNFCDKIERITVTKSAEITDENTPVGQTIAKSKTLMLSKSRIPIRARRLE